MPYLGAWIWELSAYLRATKVNVKRSNNHLSVCDPNTDLPFEVLREMSVDLDCSMLENLARPRTYLIRIATTHTLPTNQHHITVYHVSWDVGGFRVWTTPTWSTDKGQRQDRMLFQNRCERHSDQDDW
jgi:hypothetical protein